MEIDDQGLGDCICSRNQGTRTPDWPPQPATQPRVPRAGAPPLTLLTPRTKDAKILIHLVHPKLAKLCTRRDGLRLSPQARNRLQTVASFFFLFLFFSPFLFLLSKIYLLLCYLYSQCHLFISRNWHSRWQLLKHSVCFFSPLLKNGEVLIISEYSSSILCFLAKEYSKSGSTRFKTRPMTAEM